SRACGGHVRSTMGGRQAAGAARVAWTGDSSRTRMRRWGCVVLALCWSGEKQREADKMLRIERLSWGYPSLASLLFSCDTSKSPTVPQAGASSKKREFDC